MLLVDVVVGVVAGVAAVMLDVIAAGVTAVQMVKRDAAVPVAGEEGRK